MPPCASSKRPRRACGGAGEGAALVAEQLRLEQLLRDRRAVDRHERHRAPRARGVERARDQLLARAVLALDQHARRRRPGELDLRDSRRIAGERPTIDCAHALPQPRRFSACERTLRRWRCAARRSSRSSDDRLLEEVEGAEPASPAPRSSMVACPDIMITTGLGRAARDLRAAGRGRSRPGNQTSSSTKSYASRSSWRAADASVGRAVDAGSPSRPERAVRGSRRCSARRRR